MVRIMNLGCGGAGTGPLASARLLSHYPPQPTLSGLFSLPSHSSASIHLGPTRSTVFLDIKSLGFLYFSTTRRTLGRKPASNASKASPAVPLFNNLSPMLLARQCGVFIRLNRTCGHGRSSARCPYRIQSAKARFTGQEGEA